MITLTADGRLFATTTEDLDKTVSELKQYDKYPDDIDIAGPYSFVEIRTSIGFDSQEF